jgi:hypothetical protein
MIKLDRYTIMARVIPAGIVALPVAGVAYTWAPFALTWAKGSAAAAALGAAAYTLSHVTRDAGKRLEERLLVKWGGWPSTAVLRHRDSTFDEISKARFHRRLVDLGAAKQMPTKEEENADPVAADAAYSAAATWLRAKTRDTKKFPLVFEENINYGFLRNLLGSKWYGLCVAGLCIAADLPAIWMGKSHGLVAAGSVALWVCILAGVTEPGLHRQAVTYARRLIEALDQIDGAKPAAPKAHKKAK